MTIPTPAVLSSRVSRTTHIRHQEVVYGFEEANKRALELAEGLHRPWVTVKPDADVADDLGLPDIQPDERYPFRVIVSGFANN